MQAKRFVPSFAIIMLAAFLGGCAGGEQTVQTAAGPMPQYCVYNNTATGALVGAGAGAALGGGGLRSLVGAAIGGTVGAATGAQLDERCRQIALQQAMELAARQAAAARAAEQRAMAQNQPPPPQPAAYQPVDYVTPSNHKRHRVVALKNYTDPVTKQTCNTYEEFTFASDGKPRISGSGKACKGADGIWRG
jgi:hypothetical protein